LISQFKVSPTSCQFSTSQAPNSVPRQTSYFVAPAAVLQISWMVLGAVLSPLDPLDGPLLPKLSGAPPPELPAVMKYHHCPPSASRCPLLFTARTCHQ
jgi:hypothetical protein